MDRTDEFEGLVQSITIALGVIARQLTFISDILDEMQDKFFDEPLNNEE